MNNILKLKITGITSDGAGIARSETQGVIFVERALPGEISLQKFLSSIKILRLQKLLRLIKLILSASRQSASIIINAAAASYSTRVIICSLN